MHFNSHHDRESPVDVDLDCRFEVTDKAQGRSKNGNGEAERQGCRFRQIIAILLDNWEVGPR